jgi:hypothetical protein
MSKRYAVLGLSVFLALALAVPALGGPTNPVASTSASVKSIANKALKKAKAAQNTANAASAAASSASNTANSALSEAKKADNNASSASTEAKKALTSAGAAQTSANNAQDTANSAKGIAEAAKSAAESAEANANSRIKDSVQRFGTFTTEDTTSPKFASVSCETGQPVLGGGFSVGGEANKVTVSQSEEQLYGGGWFVDASAISGTTPTWDIAAVAICGTK